MLTHAQGLHYTPRVVWSYREPIGYVDASNVLHVTTARFSVTTSAARSIAAGQYAVAWGVEKVQDIDHGELRSIVRAMGYSMGQWGAKYERTIVDDVRERDEARIARVFGREYEPGNRYHTEPH